MINESADVILIAVQTILNIGRQWWGKRSVAGRTPG